MCDKCAAEGLARVFGKDVYRWYFSTDVYDYQHAYEADQKFLEYAEQYEILNAIKSDYLIQGRTGEVLP